MPTGPAGILTAFAALAATGGFLFTVLKNHLDSRRSREISARAAWEKYLERAFAHPILAVGVRKGKPRYEEYEWFISLMLYSMEEVLLYVRRDEAWIATFKAQFDHHEVYLEGSDFASYKSGYAPELVALLTAWEIGRLADSIVEVAGKGSSVGAGG